MSDHASSSTATQMAQNSVFDRFARAGDVVSGLLHLTIGYLTIRIALGSGGGNADQSGALAAVADKHTRKRELEAGFASSGPDHHFRFVRSACGAAVAMKSSRMSATAVGDSTCGKCPTPLSTSSRLPGTASCAA